VLRLCERNPFFAGKRQRWGRTGSFVYGASPSERLTSTDVRYSMEPNVSLCGYLCATQGPNPLAMKKSAKKKQSAKVLSPSIVAL
jgi:hypothetical protein